MAKSTSKKTVNLRADDGSLSADDPDRWAWLTQAAFVVAVALVIARATILEILRNPLDVIPGGGPQPRGAGASTTLVLNLLCCLPAILVLLRRALDRHYVLRWSWTHALLALLAIWSMLSTFWSADRFSAAVTSFTFLTGAVMLWTIAQLARSWLRLRVAVAACFGLLLVLIAQGLIHQFDEVPNMRDYWQEHGDEVLQQQGIEKGTFAARQYEQRIIAGEMFGFNFSPNTFAALLVMLAIVSAGIAIQRLADANEPVEAKDRKPVSRAWAFLPLLAIPLALWIICYTNSRTALITPLIAGALMLIVWKARRWLATHQRIAFLAVIVAFALGATALIAHGIYHGSMPHVSLTFRWRYWVGAFRILQGDLNWLIGVGWSQFGAHYMIHRLPEAAEEVRDPHNFIVRFFVELGVIGGALAVLWMLGLWWDMTRPKVPPAPPTPPRDGRARPPHVFLTLALIATLAMLVNIFATIDFAQDPWYALYELLKRLLFGGLLILGMSIAMLRRIDPAEFEQASAPAPWLLYATLVALGVFLIHNLIDFSLFETGPMLLFMLLAGVVLGVRWPSQAGQRKSRRTAMIALAGGVAAWLAAAIFFVWPVADAEYLAYQADQRIQILHPTAASELLQSAFERVPINADYAYRAARAQMMVQDHSAAPERVKRLLSAAIDADPMNGKYYLARAEYELSLPAPNREAVQADFRQALRLNPNDVATHIEFGDVLLHRFDLQEQAREQYRIALEKNGMLPSDEGKRLTNEQVDRIGRLLGERAP